MQLLIITTVKEYEKETVRLFKKSEITAFSNANINGFKTDDSENLISNWFSSTTDNIKSILFFTFTEKEKIDVLLSEIKTFNAAIESENPLRAIVLSVEKFV